MKAKKMKAQRTKTTPAHFEIFKKEAELWLSRLGLTDWRVDFLHISQPEGKPCRAWFRAEVEGRFAEIVLRRRNMVIVFIMPPSEIKRVVSTTSDFQRTGANIPQVSDNQQQDFALYEQLTAENGLIMEMSRDILR